jgi:hypothetical protein
MDHFSTTTKKQNSVTHAAQSEKLFVGRRYFI